MSFAVFKCDITTIDTLIKFLLADDIDLTPTVLSDIIVNGQVYQENIIMEELDIIIRIISRNWMNLQNVVLNDVTLPCSELIVQREEINNCFKAILKCLTYCESDTIKSRYTDSLMEKIKKCSSLILPLSEIENEISLKFTITTINNERTPMHQYFHTLLEVKYYLLVINYVYGDTQNLESYLRQVLEDLIILCKRTYKQQHKSAFICKCVEQFWLLLQIVSERILPENAFWQVFNECFERDTESDFILCLLKDVADLQTKDYSEAFADRIIPNFSLLEHSLQRTLRTSSNSLLPVLQSVEHVICTLWIENGKIEIYQMLWEHFSKRLNVSGKRNIDLSSSEIIKLVDTIAQKPSESKEDFEFFVGMLTVHLNHHPNHWGKIKGRIYSQLGPKKISELNNVGIFHVLLLFTALTIINVEEVSKKFVHFVDGLTTEKKQIPLVWNFYTALVIRHVQKSRSIEAITPPLIKMLEEASTSHKGFPLIATFVQDFEIIINLSKDQQLHQWLLLNTWIPKYSQKCPYADLKVFFEVLLNSLNKIIQLQVFSDWELAFKQHVYTALKYVCTSTTVPDSSGVLAAKIVECSPQILDEAFSFFNSDLRIPRVSSTFVTTILENYPAIVLTRDQETIAIQTWVRVCLLTKDNYNELTKQIIKLDIPNFIKIELTNVRDPLQAFIDCLAVNIEQNIQNSNVNKLCNICFEHADRWLSNYFSQPENEAIVLRAYTCIALAFYKIGPLLYNRHKTKSPYVSLVTSILLPAHLSMGRAVNPLILNAIKKTWHLFYESAVKLNSPNDAFIDRILRELVAKYVAHFPIVDSPMLKCLDNELLAEVILDKMSVAFFEQPTKEAESSVCKSLRIVDSFVQSTTSTAGLKLVVKKTFFGCFEVIMFHSQKSTALGLIKNVSSSPLYAQVKNEFECALSKVMEKHLAFTTGIFFQMLEFLTKIIPRDLKSFLPQIRQHVACVERKRGVGFDKTLRLHLERLEASLL